MQAQTTGRLRGHRTHHIIIAIVAALGLLVASIAGIQTLLVEEQHQPATEELSPALFREQQDPPLPSGWVDPYFKRPARFLAEDPPLPEGWVDPYFQQASD